jgi:hypothetical protein
MKVKYYKTSKYLHFELGMELKPKMQETRWRRRWSGNAYDEHETWNGKVSSIGQY